MTPQKGAGPKSNRTFFYGGNAGIVGTRARVQSEYFFDFDEPFNYKIPESEFDGRIMRKSYCSESLPPLEMPDEASIKLVKKRKKNKDKDGCC